MQIQFVMKKIFLSACLLATSLMASAQFATSNSSFTGATSSVEGWSGFRFSYAPTTLEFTYTGGEDFDLNGFSFEYVKGFGIIDNIPLFLEVGAGIEWLNYTDTESDSYEGLKYEIKDAMNLLSVNVPVNLGYKVALDENITIMPYVGLKARLGLSATEKVSAKLSYEGETKKEDETTNFYDEDDMGDATLKRFLLGWQAGVTATYNNISLGVNYGSCFTDEVFNEVDSKLGATTITVGINF